MATFANSFRMKQAAGELAKQQAAEAEARKNSAEYALNNLEAATGVPVLKKEAADGGDREGGSDGKKVPSDRAG
jgi:hypothetical protein